jgi:hypothetical protein
VVADGEGGELRVRVVVASIVDEDQLVVDSGNRGERRAGSIGEGLDHGRLVEHRHDD